jgi:hypothetical protein
VRNSHRHVRPRAPQRSQQLPAVQAREHHIQNGQVVITLLAQVQAVQTVARQVNAQSPAAVFHQRGQVVFRN